MMKRFNSTMLLLLLTATAVLVRAETGAVATAYPLDPQLQARSGDHGDTQTQTERFLKMQSSGRYASPHLQRATTAERELANQRLLESYQHPIPAFFDEEAGGEIDRK